MNEKEWLWILLGVYYITNCVIVNTHNELTQETALAIIASIAHDDLRLSQQPG